MSVLRALLASRDETHLCSVWNSHQCHSNSEGTPSNFKNCLFPLTKEQVAIVHEIKEAIGDEKLIAFISEKFDAHCKVRAEVPWERVPKRGKAGQSDTSEHSRE